MIKLKDIKDIPVAQQKNTSKTGEITLDVVLSYLNDEITPTQLVKAYYPNRLLSSHYSLIQSRLFGSLKKAYKEGKMTINEKN